MTAAIGVVRSIGLTAIVPALAKGFLAIKEHQPIGQLWFRLASAQYPSQLEQRADRSSRIVCPHKKHVLEDLRVVVTGNHNYIFRLARHLSSDVGHLFWAERCRRIKLISTDCEAGTFQCVNDVFSRFCQLWRSRRARANLDLLANVVHRALAIEGNSTGHHRGTW